MKFFAEMADMFLNSLFILNNKYYFCGIIRKYSDPSY